MDTTIQVGQDTARRLKEAFLPGTTYDAAIQALLGEKVAMEKKLEEVVQFTHTLSFKKPIAALQEDSQEQRVPFDGLITDVIMDFPSGTEFLVEVRLLYMDGKTKYFVIPSVDDSFIALDDANPHFKVNYPTKANSRLKVEWYNYDGLNSHTIPVIVTMLTKPTIGR